MDSLKKSFEEKNKKIKKPRKSRNPDIVHMNVKCDGCLVEPIKGYRYKCV